MTTALPLLAALAAATCAAEPVLEDFARTADLKLGGQKLLPESSLDFAKGPSGATEAVLRFRFVPLVDGIPTAGIQFPPGTRVVHRPARRLLVAARGDRSGLPLRATFRDRSGELHMYQLEPSGPGPGGSTWYAADISRGGFFTWGGDGNKQPDCPLSLDQLFMDGNGNQGAEGALSVVRIALDADHDNRPPQPGKPFTVEDFAKADRVALGGDRLEPASRLTVGAAGPFAAAGLLHFAFVPRTGTPGPLPPMAGAPTASAPAPAAPGVASAPGATRPRNAPPALPRADCVGTAGIRFAGGRRLEQPLLRLRLPVRGDAARLAIRANVLDAHHELHMFTLAPLAGDALPDGWRWLGVDFGQPPLFTAGGDGDKVLQWPATLDLLFIDGNGCPGAEGDLAVGPITAEPDPARAAEGAPGIALPTRPFLLERCERLLCDAGTWGDKAQPAASLALDRDQKYEGEASLRLDYRFAAVDTGQAAFAGPALRLPAGTARIRAAMRSDGQPRLVHASLIDAKGAYRTIALGTAPADRWQVLTAELPARDLAWPVTWRDVVVGREGGRPDQGRLWIDARGADLPDAPADRLAPALDLGRWPPLCWGAEDAPKGALVVEGGADEPASLPLSARLYDHRRRLLGELCSVTATAKAGTPFRQAVELKLPGFGVYEVEVRLGTRVTQHAFSWLPQRSPQWPEGPFGVNQTPQWLLDAMAGIGMAWNRAEYGWRLAEHRDGVFEDAVFAGPQQAVAAAGMRSLLLIGDWGPQQCRGAGKAPDAPALFAGYARYCGWMAKANPGPLTRHFQIWNEPNLGGFWWPKPDSGNYAESLKAAHAAIKAADPQAQVVGVNMSCIDLPYLEDLLKRGCGKAMDVLALHPYHLPEAPERFKRAVPSPTLNGEFPPGTFLQQMAKLDELLRRYDAGHLKLWLDEYGYPDRPDLYPQFAHDEWRAAALVVRQSLLALSLPQVERLFAYNARDVATGDAHAWDNATGFVRSDGSPKARFAAWATMARMLHQRRFVRSLAVGDGAFALEFAGSGGPVLALWCLEGARTLALAGRGPAPVVTDSMGAALALVPRDGAVLVGVGEEPVYLAGWTDAAPAAAPALVGGDLRCAPGESAEVAVAGARGAWTLAAPAGWAVRTLAPGRFALTPGEGAAAGAVPLLLAGDGRSLGATLAYGDTIRIEARPGAGGLALSIDNPYATARALVLTARRDGAVLPPLTVAGAPRGTTAALLPVPSELPDGFTTVPVAVAAALAPGEPAAAVAVAAGRRTVVGSAPCPALVAGALPPGRPCLLNLSHQMVMLKKDRPWGGVGDLSGAFRLGWDAQRLHLELTVTDDRHCPQADAANLWKGDSLQCALSVAGMRHEFDVAIPAGGGPALLNRAAPAGAGLGGLAASGARDGALTRYVVDLPWAAVGVTDPLAADLRLSLLVNDDDGGGRHGWAEWCEGIGLAKDPGRYGALLLAR